MDSSVYVPGYVLDRQLGSGRGGSRWAAHEESGGHQVALKLVGLADPEARAQAHREAAFLAAFDHPHVVPFYGTIDMADGLAVVTALAEGGNLAELLQVRTALQPSEVVTVCAPLAQGLAEAHQRGLVHGGIEPGQVLFTRDGKPMLSDLGLPRLTGESPGPARGTPGFAAPEVAAGTTPTPAADLYALAAIAVVALTGRFPTTPAVLPGIAPATQAALAGALSPDASQRPDAGSLANALFAMADPAPVALVTTTSEPVGEVIDGGPEPDETTDQRGQLEQPLQPRRARRAARGAHPRAPTAASVDENEPQAGDADSGTPPPPRSRPRRRIRRDVVSRAAMVLALPVIGFGAYVAWDQFIDNGPTTLPSAERVSTGDAENPVDLCGGPQPAPTEQPPEVTDWTQVVENLYTLRTSAFTEVDAMALCEVYAPTSQYLSRDAEVLQAYGEAGVRAEGLQFEVVNAEVVSHEGTRVVLQITDRLLPYQLVDDDGEVVAEKDGLAEGTWQAELVPAPDASGWRFG